LIEAPALVVPALKLEAGRPIIQGEMIAPPNSDDLVDRIVFGCLNHDPVMMHGAIVAVLEVHRLGEAGRLFGIAVERLDRQPRLAAELRAVTACYLWTYTRGRTAGWRLRSA
jgi:hypothetical protein